MHRSGDINNWTDPVAEDTARNEPTPANSSGGQVIEKLDYLEAALNHLDDGFTMYDLDLKLVAWNDRFFELVDFPAAEFAHVGKPFADFIRYNVERGEYGPGNPDRLVAERVKLARKFESHCMERRRPNGTILEVRGNPIPGVGFVTVYKDITERRLAERALAAANEDLERRVTERTRALTSVNERLVKEIEQRKSTLKALKESEEWIRLIADGVPVLIGYVDSDQRYRFANRQFEDWIGLSPEQIQGRHVDDVLGPNINHTLKEQMSQALAGNTVSNEFRLKLPNSKRIQAKSTFIPHFSPSRDVVGYFILAQDVTEQRQAESALRQADKMKAVGQLTGGLAHDFNNLLTIIVGNLNLLREQLDQDEHIVSQIDPALDAGRRGAELVKHLLAFSRKHPLRPEVVDVADLLQRMTDLLKRTLGSEVDVDMNLCEHGCHVLTNPNQMESALLNLALNARDAMPDGGRLTIGLELETGTGPDRNGNELAGDTALISITDTGTGMPVEVAERAFEPFFTTKPAGRGSGMGLAMVYGFVHQTDGTISIEHTGKSGTRITMRLPAHPTGADTSEPAPNDGSEIPSGQETILVVEDDPDVRAYTVSALRSLHYQVLEACGGSDAIAVLSQDRPIDLLLTDVVMPGSCNGFELAGTASNLRPDTRVLLMSGYPDEAEVSARTHSPRPSFLAKPFEKRDLAVAVRKTLDGLPLSQD